MEDYTFVLVGIVAPSETGHICPYCKFKLTRVSRMLSYKARTEK